MCMSLSETTFSCVCNESMSCHPQDAFHTVVIPLATHRALGPEPLLIAFSVAGRVHAWLMSRAVSASANSLIHIPVQQHNSFMTTELGLQDLGTSRNASNFSTSSSSSGGTSKSGGTSSNSSGGTSKSGGARALHHNRSSTEWHRGSGSQSGSTVESGLALFAGKRVLLVEVCDMVSETHLCVYVSVCLCLCVCACLCLCLCQCMCACLPVSVLMHVCLPGCVCPCLCQCKCACLSVSVHACVLACVRVCWENASCDTVCMLIGQSAVSIQWQSSPAALSVASRNVPRWHITFQLQMRHYK